MVQDNDPIGNRFVASLARPGGNITRLATLAPEISGKRLGFEGDRSSALPSGRARNFTQPGQRASLKETELAARELGLQLQQLDVRKQEDIDTASKPQARGVLMRSLCW
jgi:putative ABC transport system substrate-binding protein